MPSRILRLVPGIPKFSLPPRPWRSRWAEEAASSARERRASRQASAGGSQQGGLEGGTCQHARAPAIKEVYFSLDPFGCGTDMMRVSKNGSYFSAS